VNLNSFLLINAPFKKSIKTKNNIVGNRSVRFRTEPISYNFNFTNKNIYILIETIYQKKGELSLQLKIRSKN